jgi:hypothetical protein
MILSNSKPKLFVIDDFYDNPDSTRSMALNVEYQEDLRYYKGFRSTGQFVADGTREAFEKIIGQPIAHFNEVHGHCGKFQYTTSSDPQVYHHDSQKWAAMIYLTPNAPYQSGTNLLASKLTGSRHADDTDINGAFAGGYLDSTKFEVVDSVANVYNRLVIMDARCIHSAGPYFGQTITDARLIHLFFFD